MLLVHPSKIIEIDKYADEVLGITKQALMQRAGKAVADSIRSYVVKGSAVSIFAGKGNNGGDGYAAALELNSEYAVTVYDVFGSGQKSDEGKYFLKEFATRGGRIQALRFDAEQLQNISQSDCVVDAVFGTGFSGELPLIAHRLAEIFSGLTDAVKIAVDVPLGVDAENGRVITSCTYTATATVVLGFVKSGLVSYPAREYVGKLVYDSIGLNNPDVINEFSFDGHFVDREAAADLVPKRPQNSNKGSFGKVLLVTGSRAYPGAAHLSLEAALRSGVGYVTFLGESELCDSLLLKFPEAIYRKASISDITESELVEVLELTQKQNAVLIGSGSSRSRGLTALLERLLAEPGAPLILDADALNVLSEKEGRGLELIRKSPRFVILTPHPLELARISGASVDEIQSNRLAFAKSFAQENNCLLVMKGAGTVITDGNAVYINSSGSSALAKAGSGDVLAGHIAGLVASGSDPVRAAALAVYLHGRAADNLSVELSQLGVTPSDLPREIARCLSKIINKS